MILARSRFKAGDRLLKPADSTQQGGQHKADFEVGFGHTLL
jgi:hypothetical protein